MKSDFELAYEKTEIGKARWIQPAAGQTLESFQSTVEQARHLANEGKITFRAPHTESQTGKHYIDTFQIVRLA